MVYEHLPYIERQQFTLDSMSALYRSNLAATSDAAAANCSETRDDGKPNPFDSLPLEICQEVASHIESDDDLDSMLYACKSLQVALADPHFWRKRFLQKFDSPRPDSNVKENDDFKTEYKRRQNVLKYGARGQFVTGNKAREKFCLQILRDLILDSFQNGPGGNVRVRKAANVWHLSELMATPNFLDIDRRRYGGESHVWGFPESQQMAYATATERPIFKGCNGLDVDIEWCLHQINFWKYHMLREEECTLYEAYANLDIAERPHFWSSELTNNGRATVGKSWKGAYGFLTREQDIDVVRTGNNREIQVVDEFNSDDFRGEFQDLELTLTDPTEQEFNPLFESILHSLEPPVQKARTRAQKRCASPPPTHLPSRSFRFGGKGEDAEEEFKADGWLNPLPSQNGIPGWQRMTMMKYYEQDDGTVDTSSLWAYEGVCLPGGQIIIGRWWSPSSTVNGDDMYCGPFLLWCVDSHEIPALSLCAREVRTTPCRLLATSYTNWPDWPAALFVASDSRSTTGSKGRDDTNAIRPAATLRHGYRLDLTMAFQLPMRFGFSDTFWLRKFGRYRNIEVS
ncbi:uncharacterized protein MYCFIDRAFT_76089 [Pseudocercospora fijiensis CIRAD86]|uniref:F-box domain-containing protein n=1 Tax=Pseudocercospora fijiensis (strain CIRAD86) TaxID=383855 RepID=N1QB33_PSEFD|nr:uncharacterized protein MYCFIDRAFT_76089 [Pseudocercospora fijiensis CIRAD86]EME88258.1 hypothetical protein MYCFIDRAFT_76089 [Pseudocercospora fijiensis CIRAD86]